MELNKLVDGKSTHHYWELFEVEIERFFCPQLQKDWSHKQLHKLKQLDGMSMVLLQD